MFGGVNAHAQDPPAAPAEEARQTRLGSFIRVEGSLGDIERNRVQQLAREVVQQAKKRDVNAWPVLVFELRPGQISFGNATELARFLAGDALGGATSVAYVPETLTGHSVLLALACDDIIMAPDAKLGAVTPIGETIPAGTRAEYADIARRRMTVPPAVAVAMLDPAVELSMAETNNDRRFLLGEELEAFRAESPGVIPKLIKPAGEPGLFSGEQGRDLGFVSALADDRADVAKQLGLPPKSVNENFIGVLRPVRARIDGLITARVAEQNQTIISEQINGNNVNFVVIWLDSEGGSPPDAATFANFLASQDSNRVRTVAYIPTNASGDAALVALACDQIVMHRQAQLGGAGIGGPLEEDDRANLADLAKAIAEHKQRSQSLASAMVDPTVRVYAYTRAGDGFTDYFTDEEFAQQPDQDKWRKGAEVTRAGQPLRLTGEQAEKLGVAANVVDDFESFKQLYGLESDPMLVEPGWADTLIDALNSAAVSWLILVVGLWALYFELHSPGLGIGGFLAGMCFLLFFWSRHLNGTAEWLEVLLFVAGVACIALEIFVLPGFGVFGLGGGALILTSLVLASQTFVWPQNASELAETKRSLSIVVFAGLGFIAAAIAMQRFLPHTPLFSRLMLAPPTDEERDAIEAREALVNWQHLMGTEGVATTRLAPAGKAQFGDALLDVTSSGQYVAPGTPIVVVQVQGAHIVVQEVSRPA
jgi:membrane-bound serine protease (ClpP class)